MTDSSRLPRTLAILLTLVFAVVLIRTAWISDDALISLRSVLNVTHGFGLTFNIAERVQTFTHPLWVVLLTGAVVGIGNVYYATFALSILTSLAVFWIAVRRAVTFEQAWLVAIVLLFSRAFVDFSTSGLENPLTHLLLAALVAIALRASADGRPRVGALWLVGSLLYLTRPDAVLFAAPLLALSVWQAGLRASARGMALGLAPALAWTLFAIVYYGFPFPNTAHAKLAMGIHRSELWHQGLLYLVDSVDRDPITLSAVAFSLVLALATRGAARALAVGVLLYLVYVASIGGDFMAGRFMSAPLFTSVLILGWITRADRQTWLAAGVVLTVVGLTSAQVPLWSDSRFDQTAAKPSGTVDERAVYFRTHSLMLAGRQSFTNPAWPRATDPPMRSAVIETCGLMGAAGLHFGPYTYLLDECGLADPLLARMPAVFNHEWRVGHYRRMIPVGYVASVQEDANRLTDPGLQRFYDELRTITRAPALFSRHRLAVIWRMNMGSYDHLVDRRFYRHAGSVLPLVALTSLVADGTPVGADGVRDLAKPLAVTVDDRIGRRYLDITLDSNDSYLLLYLKANRIIALQPIGPVPAHRRQAGLASYTEDLPLDATRQGFDTLVVAPVAGDDRFALGHLLLDGDPVTDAELHRRVAARDASIPR